MYKISYKALLLTENIYQILFFKVDLCYNKITLLISKEDFIETQISIIVLEVDLCYNIHILLLGVYAIMP